MQKQVFFFLFIALLCVAASRGDSHHDHATGAFYCPAGHLTSGNAAAVLANQKPPVPLEAEGEETNRAFRLLSEALNNMNAQISNKATHAFCDAWANAIEPNTPVWVVPMQTNPGFLLFFRSRGCVDLPQYDDTDETAKICGEIMYVTCESAECAEPSAPTKVYGNGPMTQANQVDLPAIDYPTLESNEAYNAYVVGAWFRESLDSTGTTPTKQNNMMGFFGATSVPLSDGRSAIATVLPSAHLDVSESGEVTYEEIIVLAWCVEPCNAPEHHMNIKELGVAPESSGYPSVSTDIVAVPDMNGQVEWIARIGSELFHGREEIANFEFGKYAGSSNNWINPGMPLKADCLEAPPAGTTDPRCDYEVYFETISASTLLGAPSSELQYVPVRLLATCDNEIWIVLYDNGDDPDSGEPRYYHIHMKTLSASSWTSWPNGGISGIVSTPLDLNRGAPSAPSTMVLSDAVAVKNGFVFSWADIGGGLGDGNAIASWGMCFHSSEGAPECRTLMDTVELGLNGFVDAAGTRVHALSSPDGMPIFVYYFLYFGGVSSPGSLSDRYPLPGQVTNVPLIVHCLDVYCSEASISAATDPRLADIVNYPSFVRHPVSPDATESLESANYNVQSSAAVLDANTLLLALNEGGLHGEYDSNPMRFFVTNLFASPDGGACSHERVGEKVIADGVVYLCTRVSIGSDYAQLSAGSSPRPWAKLYEWVKQDWGFALRSLGPQITPATTDGELFNTIENLNPAFVSNSHQLATSEQSNKKRAERSVENTNFGLACSNCVQQSCSSEVSAECEAFCEVNIAGFCANWCQFANNPSEYSWCPICGDALSNQCELEEGSNYPSGFHAFIEIVLDQPQGPGQFLLPEAPVLVIPDERRYIELGTSFQPSFMSLTREDRTMRAFYYFRFVAERSAAFDFFIPTWNPEANFPNPNNDPNNLIMMHLVSDNGGVRPGSSVSWEAPQHCKSDCLCHYREDCCEDFDFYDQNCDQDLVTTLFYNGYNLPGMVRFPYYLGACVNELCQNNETPYWSSCTCGGEGETCLDTEDICGIEAPATSYWGVCQLEDYVTDGKASIGNCACDAECGLRGDCCCNFNVGYVPGMAPPANDPESWTEAFNNAINQYGCLPQDCGGQGSVKPLDLPGVPHCWCQAGAENQCGNYEDVCQEACQVGDCGGPSSTSIDTGCDCSAQCITNNNCCDNYASICEEARVCLPSDCGRPSSVGDCSCSVDCLTEGDCCDNYLSIADECQTIAAGNSPTDGFFTHTIPTWNSCAVLGCLDREGSEFNWNFNWAGCSCEDGCYLPGSPLPCCSDFTAECSDSCVDAGCSDGSLNCSCDISDCGTAGEPPCCHDAVHCFVPTKRQVRDIPEPSGAGGWSHPYWVEEAETVDVFVGIHQWPDHGRGFQLEVECRSYVCYPNDNQNQCGVVEGTNQCGEPCVVDLDHRCFKEGFECVEPTNTVNFNQCLCTDPCVCGSEEEKATNCCPSNLQSEGCSEENGQGICDDLCELSSQTCACLGCGTNDNDRCQCDIDCLVRGDCCNDFTEQCPCHVDPCNNVQNQDLCSEFVDANSVFYPECSVRCGGSPCSETCDSLPNNCHDCGIDTSRCCTSEITHCCDNDPCCGDGSECCGSPDPCCGADTDLCCGDVGADPNCCDSSDCCGVADPDLCCGDVGADPNCCDSSDCCGEDCCDLEDAELRCCQDEINNSVTIAEGCCTVWDNAGGFAGGAQTSLNYLCCSDDPVDSQCCTSGTPSVYSNPCGTSDWNGCDIPGVCCAGPGDTVDCSGDGAEDCDDYCADCSSNTCTFEPATSGECPDNHHQCFDTTNCDSCSPLVVTAHGFGGVSVPGTSGLPLQIAEITVLEGSGIHSLNDLSFGGNPVAPAGNEIQGGERFYIASNQALASFFLSGQGVDTNTLILTADFSGFAGWDDVLVFDCFTLGTSDNEGGAAYSAQRPNGNILNSNWAPGPENTSLDASFFNAWTEPTAAGYGPGETTDPANFMDTCNT